MPKIPEEYIGDFLRGYFDGDGWVSKNGSQISIVSASEYFAADLTQLFIKYNIKYTQYYDKRKQHTLYDIRLTSQTEIKKFYHLLYDNCEDKLYLVRKKERFNSLFE